MCGCGPASATITGDVTVDGKPAELGTITYSSADDSKSPPATAELKNGKYEIRTVAGKKFVGISVFKVIDKKKESPAADSPWVDITEEIITKTELTFEAKPGANVKEWKLDSKNK